MTNLEEVVDKLAEALASEAAIDMQIFIESYVPDMIEEIRVMRNEKNLRELELAELRNQVEELE